MGQYYHIFNLDKRQQLLPFDYDNGLKLMEWSYNKNCLVLALMNLLTDEWKGDRVYVIGDYADLSDKDEVWAPVYEKLLQELGGTDDNDTVYNLCDVFERVLPDHTLRDRPLYHEENYSRHAAITACTQDTGIRYVYNHTLKNFVDLTKCPIDWTYVDETGALIPVSIAPLPLLLAMGNGRGGGDYRNEQNENLLGGWCETVTSIEVAQDKLPGTEHYTEFRPNFTENDPLIPYDSLDR